MLKSMQRRDAPTFPSVTFLLPLALLVVWIVLMVYAFQGKYIKLPVIGDYAERYATPTI